MQTHLSTIPQAGEIIKLTRQKLTETSNRHPQPTSLSSLNNQQNGNVPKPISYEQSDVSSESEELVRRIVQSLNQNQSQNEPNTQKPQFKMEAGEEDQDVPEEERIQYYDKETLDRMKQEQALQQRRLLEQKIFQKSESERESQEESNILALSDASSIDKEQEVYSKIQSQVGVRIYGTIEKNYRGVSKLMNINLGDTLLRNVGTGQEVFLKSLKAKFEYSINVDPRQLL